MGGTAGLWLVLEEEQTFLVADKDIGTLLAADESGGDLRADARVVVDQVGYEFSLAIA